MASYSTLTVAELLDAFASNQPVPGGGSASALAAAVGVSLLIMVGSLPRTRTGRPEERAALDTAAARLRPMRDELRALIDRDSAAYTSVIDAIRLPKTPGQEAMRREAIDAAMQAATDAPLATMRACRLALREAADIAGHGSANAASDAAVGIELLMAAVRGAALNVDTNIGALKNAAYVAQVRNERQELEEASQADAQRAMALIQRS
jgi:formiminotetrahydrofolate cyclodeaminase